MLRRRGSTLARSRPRRERDRHVLASGRPYWRSRLVGSPDGGEHPVVVEARADPLGGLEVALAQRAREARLGPPGGPALRQARGPSRSSRPSAAAPPPWRRRGGRGRSPRGASAPARSPSRWSRRRRRRCAATAGRSGSASSSVTSTSASSWSEPISWEIAITASSVVRGEVAAREERLEHLAASWSEPMVAAASTNACCTGRARPAARSGTR